MDLQRSKFDVAAAVQEVVMQVAPLAEGRPIELKTELPVKAVAAVADRVKLVQIVTNLLSNAVKYTDEGTVALAVGETEDAEFGPALRISVRDTGVGIKPQEQQHLFKEFTQIDGSSRRRVGGTGLGLCIAQQYANMHGGRIDVVSEFGKGSEFTLLLPIKPDEATAAAESDQPEMLGVDARNGAGGARQVALQPESMTILCVDDEPDVLKFLGLTFEDAGYNVILAENHDSAIAQAENHRPDLICLDLRMPDKDGFDVLDSLRRDAALGSVPVVVVSASDEQTKALDAGARYCLAKPVNPDTLLAIVRDVLSGKDQKALVVEDDPDTAKLIGEVLTDHGIAVRTASNGKEALARLARFTPSVIVLDLMMPVMDGPQFLEHIQMDAAWRSIPVIILTAKTLSPAEVARLSRVSQAILTKGRASTEELVQTILGTVRSEPHAVPEEVAV